MDDFSTLMAEPEIETARRAIMLGDIFGMALLSASALWAFAPALI